MQRVNEFQKMGHQRQMEPINWLSVMRLQELLLYNTDHTGNHSPDISAHLLRYIVVGQIRNCKSCNDLQDIVFRAPTVDLIRTRGSRDTPQMQCQLPCHRDIRKKVKPSPISTEPQTRYDKYIWETRVGYPTTN
jgi:hypothetical protein